MRGVSRSIRSIRDRIRLAQSRVIQTLTSNRTDQPLHIRVLPKGLRRTQNFSDTEPSGCFRELLSIAFIPVTHEKPRSAVPWESFEQLMGYPFRGGILGHRNVHGPACRTQMPFVA